LLRFLALLLSFVRNLFIFITTCFFREMLELPKSVLPALAVFRIGLSNEHNGWYLKLLIKLHVLKLHQIDSIQIIPKNGIIVVQLLPQVRVDNECAIVLSEV
jgi:hypothetical protein